jgi:hypothetical protein
LNARGSGILPLEFSPAHAAPLPLHAVSMLGICSNRVKQKSEIILARFVRRNGLRGKEWIIGDPAGFAITKVRRRIIGTLLEWALEPRERHKFGAREALPGILDGPRRAGNIPPASLSLLNDSFD